MKTKRVKFQTGQVVKHRVLGGFYMKILHRHQATGLKWVVLEQGNIAVYREEQLLPLTLRERGPRRPAARGK